MPTSVADGVSAASREKHAPLLTPPFTRGCRANLAPTARCRRRRLIRASLRVSGRGSGGCRGVLVELQEVVGGREQPPFGPGGGSSTSGEAGEPAVVLGISEDRLNELRPLLVEGFAALAGEHRAHERVCAAGPSRPRIS